MHELSIALSILDMAQEEAEQRGAARVEAIHLKLGPLSGVVKEALQSAYNLARENTALENARLIIVDVPVLVYCQNCQTQRPIVSLQCLCCSHCDSPALEIISGKELQVTALEVID